MFNLAIEYSFRNEGISVTESKKGHKDLSTLKLKRTLFDKIGYIY